MEEMPFADDAFDCVFAMHSAGHADTVGMNKVMKEIKRVLKPDGEVFMTLCSKETWTYAQSGLPKVDSNTVIKTDGPEQGVPHFFVDKDDIENLFADFELTKVRHIDDCFSEGKWKNQKHYFIEAVIRKEPKKRDYSDIIGKALSLFEHACNTFLPSTSNPKFLLFIDVFFLLVTKKFDKLFIFTYIFNNYI